MDSSILQNIKYFSQVYTEEIIDIPFAHPDIDQVVSIVVECKVIRVKVINTIKGKSYEGQCFTGKELAVEVKIQQKMLYASENDENSVHILERDYFQIVYIVIPGLIEGSDPDFLVKNKTLHCKVEVEDVSVKCMDKRKVFINFCLIAKAELSPAFVLCCSIFDNLKGSGVFIMHGDGTHASSIQFNRKSKYYKPLWSPLGREISFLSDNKSNLLNIFSLQTHSLRTLIESSNIETIGSYCWSICGKKLFFSGRIQDAREIFAVGTKGTGFMQLTDGNGMYGSYDPKCSPSGQKIAFRRTLEGLKDIWTMDNYGHDLCKLTSCGSVKYFDWSPDGKYIVYISSIDGAADKLYLTDTECMSIEEIHFEQPLPFKKKVMFSPEGLSFAFIGSLMDNDDIYVFDFNNNILRNITNNLNNEKITEFIWSADSDRIYYSVYNLFKYSVNLVSLEGNKKFQLVNNRESKIGLSYRPKIC